MDQIVVPTHTAVCARAHAQPLNAAVKSPPLVAAVAAACRVAAAHRGDAMRARSPLACAQPASAGAMGGVDLQVISFERWPRNGRV